MPTILDKSSAEVLKIAEVKTLVEKTRESKAIKSARFKRALFNHLIDHYGTPSTTDNIWNSAFLPNLNRTPSELDLSPDGTAGRVRVHAHALRKQLNDMFLDVREGWIIELPKAIPSQGFELRIWKRGDTTTLACRFWQPHLDEADRSLDITIVYVEQLFYRDLNTLLVFRYYDCNADHTSEALTVLKDNYPHVFHDKLRPIYPYVARGELQARDQIRDWFDKNASIAVQELIPRRVEPDDISMWADSLILLGNPYGNTMIQEVMDQYPFLPITTKMVRESGELISIDATLAEEKAKLSRLNIQAMFHNGKAIIRAASVRGNVLAVLSRLPNPKNDGGTLTIINCSYGRAVERIAALLTDNEKLRGYKELSTSLPQYFQAVFSVPSSETDTSNHKPYHLPMIAWRVIPVEVFEKHTKTD